jgi:D-3-phosphoglycerate dehydrogenase
MPKVLIAAPVHAVLIAALEKAGYACIFALDITQQEALATVAQYEGIITSTRLQINKKLLDQAAQLKFIGRMGSGMEIIDMPYAAQKGVVCVSSPEGNANAVAEHALGMLLGLSKQIVKSNNELHQGIWEREANRGFELEGKTIAIIGFGHTGSALAHKLSVFNMSILAYDNNQAISYPDYVKAQENMQHIYEVADIISYHVPASDENKYLFNEQVVGNFQKPIVLMNTSRGNVVDPEAVAIGLKKGKIKQACFDVWETEPLSKMNEQQKTLFNSLLADDRVLITPHIAGYSHEALDKMSLVLAQKLKLV